jgi:hypothetical protein
MTAEPLAAIGAEVRRSVRVPKVKTGIYLGPVTNGIKHRVKVYNVRLGKWVEYTCHASHIIR